MHKNILIAFGITTLFLGLAIQPSIATPQPEKIDVEPDDVEGLVAQLHVVINEILQDYGHNPMVRSLCNMILDLTWYPGKIIICGTLFIIDGILYILWLYAWQVFGLSGQILLGIALSIFVIFITFGCFPYWPYKSLKLIPALTEANDITNIVDECPCMQQ